MSPAARARAGRLRAAGVLLHRWLGLLVGAVFLLVGCTGSVVTFGPELLAWQHPQLAAPAPQAWEAHRADVLSRLTGEHPPGHVELVRFPGGALGAYEVYLADESQEYRHAVTGEVLHTRPAWGDWLMISRELHTHLGGGETGELVLGWLGVAMLVLIFTGLWLWWPHRGRWKMTLRYPDTRLAGPLLYWWHKTGGAVTLVLLAFVTLTGTAMVFHGAAQAVLTAAFGGTPRALPLDVSAGPAVDWAAVTASLEVTLPEGRTVFLYPPATAADAVVARKKMPEELHPNGRSFIVLDGQGRVAFHEDASVAAAGLRFTNAIYPLHSGRTGHAWWQWTVALLGLLPMALFVTGFVVWRLRRAATASRHARVLSSHTHSGQPGRERPS